MESADFSFSYHELLTLYLMVSPTYVLTAAAEHGAGNVVVGLQASWDEISQMAHGYIALLHEREIDRARYDGDVDREPAILRDAAFLATLIERVGSAQKIQEVEDPMGYRRLMCQQARGLPHIIQGESVPIEIPWLETRKEIEALRLGVLRCTGNMLVDCPELNRTVLPARSSNASVYARMGPNVVVPLDLNSDDLSVIVLDGQHPDLRKHMREEFRELRRTRKHPLAVIGNQLLAEWLDHGFIASWGGAWISDLSWGMHGKAWPIFVNGTGIPISIVINPPTSCPEVNGLLSSRTTTMQVVLTVAIDHRALDGKEGSRIHEYMRTNLRKYVEEFLG